MDPRTLRAAIVADLSTFATIAGLGWFLGFSLVPSLVVGAVAGSLAFLLIVLASRRAETFSPTDPTAHLRLDRDPSTGLPADDVTTDPMTAEDDR